MVFKEEMKRSFKELGIGIGADKDAQEDNFKKLATTLAPSKSKAQIDYKLAKLKS